MKAFRALVALLLFLSATTALAQQERGLVALITFERESGVQLQCGHATQIHSMKVYNEGYILESSETRAVTYSEGSTRSGGLRRAGSIGFPPRRYEFDTQKLPGA